MKWIIVFDAELEDPRVTCGEFNSYEDAVKFLDGLNSDELKEVYEEWCVENGMAEDEMEFSEDMEITILEMVEFTPKVDVETILDHIRDQAAEFGGEYADGYLSKVTDEQMLELQYALADTFDKWCQKHKHIPYFYQCGKVKSY